MRMKVKGCASFSSGFLRCWSTLEAALGGTAIAQRPEGRAYGLCLARLLCRRACAGAGGSLGGGGGAGCFGVE